MSKELQFINVDGENYGLCDNVARDNIERVDRAKQDVERVEWTNNTSLDNLTKAGQYLITGTIGTNSSFPIINTGVVAANLTVLVTDDGKGNSVVTQVLNLNNNAGGEGNVYSRSKQGTSWSDWGKLQRNVEVNAIGLGQSKTFDDLTDNGLYSGVNVYSVGVDNNGLLITSYETFILVVVNAYATGGGVTQLKYSLKLDGAATVLKRTYINEWSAWSEVATAFKLPIATSTELGGIVSNAESTHTAEQVSAGVVVDENGKASVVIPAATTESAGVMSAEDKMQLKQNANDIAGEIARAEAAERANADAIAAEIARATAQEKLLESKAEDAVTLALRQLYIAAGAKYNDTDENIVRTAPWGEAVQHLPKRYYLNGLGDITEKEMLSIYTYSPNVLAESAYAEKSGRTFILNAGSSSIYLKNSISGLFFNCKGVETIGDGNFVIYIQPITTLPSENVFYSCNNLKHINSRYIFGMGTNMSFRNWFNGCTALITCKITRLAVNVSFLDSPNISYDSILYIINNVEGTLKKNITITLHHDAYARLTASSEIVAALDAKNTSLASQGGKVSLVCATHSEEVTPNA